MAIHKPKWFSDDYVMVSTGPTCGLTKGGRALNKVDPVTARRIQIVDPETGGLIDVVNDKLLEDMEELVTYEGVPNKDEISSDTLNFIPASKLKIGCAVPIYYDHRYYDHFCAEIKENPIFSGFSSAPLSRLVKDKLIVIRKGHGSPKQEQRIGEIPYIKVSDLRAGTMNINPTNRVPKAIASEFWKGLSSGIQAFDLICPERTSKNIGDFCVVMPGQEQVLLTKEVIIMRPGPMAYFDAFYILWAMTLKIVRDQWRRIVFMQTNREDVGKRYLEIHIPIPPNREKADEVSKTFKEYYETIARARIDLQKYLVESSLHHFYVSGAEESESYPVDEIVGDIVDNEV